MSDNQFTPAATTVPVGTTVTWTWQASTQHNVTFNAQNFSQNQTSGNYSRQFNTAGTFNYSCTLHPGMDGSVTVQ